MASTVPSLRTIAAEAGVTSMAVSLALRNSHRVSAPTRQRILKVAAALGYRPDPMLNKLMHHMRARKHVRYQTTIACLAPRYEAGPSMRAYLQDIVAGVERRADTLGLKVDRFVPDDLGSPHQLQRLLTSRGITGLILMPMPLAGKWPYPLDWKRFTVVSTTSSVESPRFHTVIPNHFENMVDACHRLQKAGCRRIGLAISSDVDRRVHQRWTAAMAWHHLGAPESFVAPFVYDAMAGQRPADLLLTWVGRERPDAVILHSTHHELETLRKLPIRERPKIVSLIPAPGVFGLVDQSPATVGEVAVEILAGLMATNTTGIPKSIRTTLVTGAWRTSPKSTAPSTT
jgi:LacI family transcriptional regulator